MSRGSALLETLVIGFATVLLALQALVAAGRLTAAGTAAEEVARYAAEAAARHGSAESARVTATRLLPGATVASRQVGDRVVVRVTVTVPLLGPASGVVSTLVSGEASATIAPFRSGR